MSIYDLPDPSDIPGTSDFAAAQAQMERDAEIDDLVEIVEQPTVKMACLSRVPNTLSYRVVIGTKAGVTIDGVNGHLDAVLLAFGLDGQTRRAIQAALREGKTVAAVQLADGGFIVWEVSDRDDTGVPDDPARWFYDRLAPVTTWVEA